MAVDPKKRQKKLQKKAQKRKQKTVVKKQAKGLRPEKYLEHPIIDCLVGASVDKVGMGSVLLARETPYAEVAVSAFVVDTYCLGVREAFFTVMRKADYLSKLKPMLTKTHAEGVNPVEPCCARKLLQGAAAYAKELGFDPAEEYWRVEKLFGDADPARCETEYTYGHEGKPCYVQGPNDDMKTVRYVLERLTERVGEGNFDYVVEIDGEQQASRPELLEMLE
ncbi:hypothetical protein MIT9_P1795 [Methylomarinovum caldicuralii]|uniref:Uncharacterized protein n=1 Tax=Methylomarinovum caldicuralii TaxID=438856 RepID=A0AAU9C0L4_9GAMM|nr:hypothetical protein [Methylomarinovum caldicuralii]BCX82210.1 hypothetical protein MIT9_P1795 [Methylomarinovum caldicuralii]